MPPQPPPTEKFLLMYISNQGVMLEILEIEFSHWSRLILYCSSKVRHVLLFISVSRSKIEWDKDLDTNYNCIQKGEKGGKYLIMYYFQIQYPWHKSSYFVILEKSEKFLKIVYFILDLFHILTKIFFWKIKKNFNK